MAGTRVSTSSADAVYAGYRTLLLERRGAILTVTMNRPEHRNAADVVMHNELSRVFFDIAGDDAVGVVVLTGAGKAFSAGGDFAAMKQKILDQAKWVATVEEARRIFLGMTDLDKPIIARVNGAASGLGATLAVYSDIIIASERARFGDPHVKAGLVAGDGGALVWPLLIGFPKAKEYLLLGDYMDAREAERIGLINRAVPEAELDQHVYGMAERLAAGPRRAIGWTKRAINQTLRTLALATMETGFSLETLSHLTRDHSEAVDAFLEKREPRFNRDAD
jgi:enoyl-CoA hydratase